MNVKKGTIYKIAKHSFGNFNSAETLKVTSHSRSIVSFTLGNKKGYGSMPLQHLRYLLKKNELAEVLDEKLMDDGS
ncbi:hypothetical protein [Alkalihalobacillus sp. AL-G]|uniref:hypothetical protein n=1 Tax=Alkalihalobacillus sp. AL-G TaxID=2926399 RepID=UPI00272A8E51|nr:hypothetical protein [Alkalihalobacillus sp. AL-G]WLD91618.1 hypothetical protein MOJ78_11220 [Alkalihalobacillus sp. AL-G]